MKERLERQAAEREAARIASDLRDAESRNRWAKIYAPMNLDQTIGIHGKQGGKDIVIRAIVGPGGRIKEVS